MEHIRYIIETGQATLGIELGSTRIKALLIDKNHTTIAQGSHEWENKFENGIWTYSLTDIWNGLQNCYKNLAMDVKIQYGITLEKVSSIGISAMMHGYMAFDKDDNSLVPFRTWRNTITEKASTELTDLFKFHIPQRWSVAHLYQALLNNEHHVKDVDYITTLSGYIHWQLTGQKVLGVGDASGMFPIDFTTKDWHETMLTQFDELVAPSGFDWNLRSILPKVLVAGDNAGVLTEKGAKLLDPSGNLKAGVPLCPPEGDAGTGMVATNSVKVRTGNVSAGTSIFGMLVLEKELQKVHDEIDVVTTPSGNLVAMAHCNNFTSDLNAWIGLFKEFAAVFGMEIDMNTLFATLYTKALEGDMNCGGLLSYNYLSGEHVTGFEAGRPLFLRTPNSNFTLANFMRVHLYSALASLKIGMDILLKEEKVSVDEILGHGGFFKTKGVGQSILAAALNTPVSVMETAAEGGAWGIAVLASYMMHKCEDETLESYLDKNVFNGQKGNKIDPDPVMVEGFNQFSKYYLAGLPIERSAVDSLS